LNNKEFVAELSRRLGYSQKDSSALLSALVSEVSGQLEEDRIVSIQDFGNFEVRKKLERVVISPATQQRMLVPPRLVVAFKPSTQLKDKFNVEA
jgi:DNA-binding protein HU-beta